MSNFKTTLKDLQTTELFAPNRSAAWEFLSGYTYPWESLPDIRDFILKLGASLDDCEYETPQPNVWIHKSAKVAPTAYFGDGDTVIICEEAEIRHCAYIRANVLVGAGAVVGNSCELKNVILFDKAQVAHFNYVGDSILGYKSHFGAGVITSNLKSDGTQVVVKLGDDLLETGLRKFGAMVGDNVEVGCNAVLNPGAVIGVGATIYPLSMVRGFVPPNSIYKKQNEIVERVTR